MSYAGDAIAARLGELGKTSAWLARALGHKSTSWVSQVVKGQKNPTDFMLTRIARELDVTVEDLKPPAGYWRNTRDLPARERQLP